MIVLDDLVFHKLWDLACKCDTFSEYYERATNRTSTEWINLRPYKLDINKTYSLLSHIYQISQISIQDIFDEYQFTNATFGHRYCIPRRTVQDWVSGKNRVPPYIRLLVLETQGKKLLPRGFTTKNRNKNIDLSNVKKESIDDKLAEIDKKLEKFGIKF